MGWNIIFACFVLGVTCLGHPQHIGNFLLCQISVVAQIPNSWIHKTHLICALRDRQDALFLIGTAHQIVQADMVEVSDFNQCLDWHVDFSIFIIGICALLHIQICGNFNLLHVMVNPQVANTPKIYIVPPQ